MSKSNDVVVTIAAKDQAAYTRARNAFIKSAGTYRETIGRIATAYFKEPITVAAFAAFVKEDLKQGKGVSEADKAERGAIRSRIHDGLSKAGMLKVNAKASKAQRKPRQTTAPASAADKAEEVQAVIEAEKPKQSALFTAFVGIVGKASRATLQRMANEIARLLAEQVKEGKEA